MKSEVIAQEALALLMASMGGEVGCVWVFFCLWMAWVCFAFCGGDGFFLSSPLAVSAQTRLTRLVKFVSISERERIWPITTG